MTTIATINGTGVSSYVEIDTPGTLVIAGDFDGAALRLRVKRGSAWSYLAGPDGTPLRITDPVRIADVDLAAGDEVAVESSGANATRPGGTSLTVGIEGAPLDKPVNTTAPVVTITDTGTSVVLSCSRGWWSEQPTEWTFQWQTDAGAGYANIDGETGSTYAVAAGNLGDPIKCLVTAKNAIGTAASAASSNAVTITAPAGVDASISGYTTAPDVGDVLEASHTATDDGNPEGTATYQWYQVIEATPTDIEGETGSTYTVRTEDEGLVLGVTVTVTNGMDDDSDTAETPAAIYTRAPTGLTVAITGYTTAPAVDDVLTATGTLEDDGYPTADQTYQWYQVAPGGNTDIDGETAQTYTVLAGDVGMVIGCEVTATNASGSVTADAVTDDAVVE